MTISTEEFETMVHQLLEEETVRFDALCQIAQKVLPRSVKRWCDADDCLRGRGYEEDIMQNIQLKLMSTTISYFLLRDGVEGPVNRDPDGFRSWMFQVARNVTRDFGNCIRKNDFHTQPLQEDPDSEPDLPAEPEAIHTERLKEAVDIALQGDVQIYKTLTWLAQCLTILEADVSKHQSNGLIVEAFSKKTLSQMYQMLQDSAKEFPWLALTQAQHQKILDALNQPWDDKLRYADVCYEVFFMKKGGKNTISDWMNRMNNRIRRAMEDGSSND